MAKFCSKISSYLPDLSMHMSTNTEGKDQFPITNSEGNTTTINNKTATSSSRGVWSGLKDPRIVRVSRFGGKDRHSKVSTIRGLRDRRVRLSVSTAIQLYDLQDRLGLNQPSKVVDWLLNAAQHEIDKLPPLENFIQFHQSLHQASEANNYDHDQCFNVEGEDQIEIGSPQLMYQDVGISNVQSSFHQDHNLLSNNSRGGGGGGGGDQALGLVSNIGGFPYASNCYHWDQSNRTYFSQLGIISSQVDVAPSSMFSSYTTTTTVPFELDGSSAQQNLPLNSNATFRNSFHSGSPKARPF